MNNQKLVPEKTFPCKECGKVYTDESGMLIHFLQFHRRSIDVEISFEPFPCSICDLNFLSYRELQKHFQVHTVQPLFCKQCNFKCTFESVLNSHMKVHNTVKTVKVFGDVECVEIEDDINNSECDPFTCTDCGDSFHCYMHLKWHLITHGKKKYYSCSECEYKTIYQYNFKLHNKQHSGTKQFACSECNYKINNEKLLQMHTNSHKQKERKLRLRKYRNLNWESETSTTSTYVNLSYFTAFCTTLTKSNGPKQNHNRKSIKKTKNQLPFKHDGTKKKFESKPLKEQIQKKNKQFARHGKVKNHKILVNHENVPQENEINILSRKSGNLKRKSALPFKCSYCSADCASLNQINMHKEIHNINNNQNPKNKIN